MSLLLYVSICTSIATLMLSLSVIVQTRTVFIMSRIKKMNCSR
nr:MAG TPA: hypothetical protein [Inoviridae sp.]